MTAPLVTVYHGTSGYALDPIRTRGPERVRRGYVPKPCFCTTRSLRVGQLFAARKTGADDFTAGRITGVVLEFTLSGVAGRDYAPARDPACMQDESEIAVFNTRRLALVAVWRCEGATWRREPVDESLPVTRGVL